MVPANLPFSKCCSDLCGPCPDRLLGSDPDGGRSNDHGARPGHIAWGGRLVGRQAAFAPDIASAMVRPSGARTRETSGGRHPGP
ncbi:hypothetical protein EES42_42755 [Streptomyces sp. ADI95-17]|nr:hypothetical protein EES42_42755 [Streptomyces sp. ADI95-17]